MIDPARFCARAACGHLDARHLGRGDLGPNRGGCFACPCPGFLSPLVETPLDHEPDVRKPASLAGDHVTPR